MFCQLSGSVQRWFWGKTSVVGANEKVLILQEKVKEHTCIVAMKELNELLLQKPNYPD